MTKTKILLGTDTGISLKATRWLMINTGLLMVVLGAQWFTSTPTDPDVDTGHLPYFMAWGLLYVLFALARFSRWSPLAPRVEINKEGVLLRSALLSKNRRLLWKDISAIHFKSYYIEFDTSEAPVSFDYHAESGRSIRVKSALREQAESLGITVKGG
ncbi:MAG: hypothetical protein AAGA85_03175 [Bacteroidota bacterium]